MPSVVQSNVRSSRQAANVDNRNQYLARGHLESSTINDFVQDKHVLTEPIDCCLLSTLNKKQKSDRPSAERVIRINLQIQLWMIILISRMIDLLLCLHHQRNEEQILYPDLHLNLSFSSKIWVKDVFNNTVQISVSFFSTNSSMEIGLL